MARRSGPSVRLKLTLSYAGFLMVAGALMLAAAWVAGQRQGSFDFLWDYLPDEAISTSGGLVPGNTNFLLRTFAPAAAIVLACLLLFGLAGGWILAGRMLRPLTRITDAARRAATGSLSHRIDLPGRDDELRELADAFDAMLARLEAHVAEQQRFAANASHELRTPLATTKTLLDVARRDPERDPDELIERLQSVNTRAIELTEALLLLSRADRRTFAREPVDLSLVVEEATETLLPLAEQRGIALDVGGSPAPTTGSAPLLLRMVTNVVQNAIVHNVPAGASEAGTVTVRTSSEPGASVLRVENTGPMVPVDLIPTLVEPFQRGVERARARPDADDHAGVGLGLAIVHSIVTAHDGTLSLGPRPTGGLAVTIRLPDGRT